MQKPAKGKNNRLRLEQSAGRWEACDRALQWLRRAQTQDMQMQVFAGKPRWQRGSGLQWHQPPSPFQGHLQAVLPELFLR